MIIKKCTFDELPDAMKKQVLFIREIPVSEYRLVIWTRENTCYYNDLKESEVQRFVALVESEKRFLNSRTMDSIYSKYGYAVFSEIREAHEYLLKKADKTLAAEVVQEYLPVIENAMKKSSIPLNHSLIEAMDNAADKGKHKFKEWSTNKTYIYFLGYLLGSGKLKWEERLL